jgi:hypothetical protein
LGALAPGLEGDFRRVERRLAIQSMQLVVDAGVVPDETLK